MTETPTFDIRHALLQKQATLLAGHANPDPVDDLTVEDVAP